MPEAEKGHTRKMRACAVWWLPPTYR